MDGQKNVLNKLAFHVQENTGTVPPSTKFFESSACTSCSDSDLHSTEKRWQKVLEKYPWKGQLYLRAHESDDDIDYDKESECKWMKDRFLKFWKDKQLLILLDLMREHSKVSSNDIPSL